jgi:hypothetical protein
MLGVGQVVVSADGMAEYRVRDLNSIIKHIIPLFDKHLLLTSKYYNFNLFKQAALVKNNGSLSTEQKNNLLKDLKRKIRSDNYISPA